MGKKRLLALMCAVSILLTTFMPLSALGDEGTGEVIVTEALTEEVVSLSATGEGGSAASSEPNTSTGTGTSSEPNTVTGTGTSGEPSMGTGTGTSGEPSMGTGTGTSSEPNTSTGTGTSGEPNTGTGTGTSGEPNTSTGTGTGGGSGTGGTTNPTPTVPPLPAVTEWMVLNDCNNAAWQDGTIEFVLQVSALNEKSVFVMYDATAANGSEPLNYIKAATSTYWNIRNVIPEAGSTFEYVYLDQFGQNAWQLAGFNPQGSGSVQYGWRLYATATDGTLLKNDGSPASGLADAYYQDYAPTQQSTIAIYDPLTVPQYAISPSSNVNVNDEITIEMKTGLIVDDIDIIDAKGQAINANSTYYISGNAKYWKIKFSFGSNYSGKLWPRLHATIGKDTRIAADRPFTIVVGDGGSITPGEPGTPTTPTTGEIRLANVPSANVVPGMSVTFNLDIEYAAADGSRYAYNAQNSKFFDIIDYIEITPNATNANYPFDADGAKRIMLRSLEEAQASPFRYTLRARSNLENGTYPFEFTVRYKLKSKSEPETDKTVSGVLFVFGADAPNPTQEPSPTEKPDLGYVRFIQIPSISARAGDTVHLDMGVEFAASDGKRYSYTDADFYKYVDYIEIQPEITDTYPFVADGNINRKIIHSQSEALSSPFKYDMQVKSTLGAGTHTFNFTLRYRLKGSTSTEPDKTETCMLFVSEPAQPTVDPQAGYVRFAQMPNANAKVGESLTLDLGVEFASSDGQRFSYTDPEFYQYVDYIEIQPEITDNYPFVVTDELSRKIIRSLEDAQTNPFTYGVQVKKSLTNGAYTFNFTLRYRLKGKAEPEADKTEAGMVFVTGAKTPGSGGGGGGGTVLPNPQAKLIVDSLSTNPSAPKAGDTFDINLVLKNTNEKQYIQNIKVSYTVDNDVLLPANGSSSFYIPKINAGETYELVIPVTARPDMPDSPVKMNLTMEYEDKKVSSVSANQVVILNVKQVQKIKLDQLVLPQGEVLVGESASFTMNIINSGRTTLYNVSAAMLDNDMFTTGGSSYIGNLEAGASKQMELDIYPNAEGAIDGTVRVTYEDANGNQQYEDVPYSIYASPVDDGSGDIYDPIIEPTPEPTYEISNILENLPWWVYGSAGLFVICIVMLLAVAAHRRKAASMMDYDDD